MRLEINYSVLSEQNAKIAFTTLYLKVVIKRKKLLRCVHESLTSNQYAMVSFLLLFFFFFF